jgi:hypothetical protein
VVKTCEPQVGQKWKTPSFRSASSETRVKSLKRPLTCTWSLLNPAWIPNALPVRRWQAWQLQIETEKGSPAT